MSYSPLARCSIGNNSRENSRLAKPRGGRRPGVSRPATSPAQGMQQQQSLPSPFSQSNSSTVNGTQQQQGGFGFGQQPNGDQPNQTSASFPPFGNGGNTGFNSSFTAPSSAFSFTGGQNEAVNNPFAAISSHSTPPPQSGFKGSIFDVPSELAPHQKAQQKDQKPLFASNPPFQNGKQDNSTLAQSQTPKNPFEMSGSQQTSNQAGSSLFPQPSAQQQQQPPASVFDQSNNQQPTQSTLNIFGHLSSSQSQAPSNPFGQGASIFQQPPSSKPASNLFAHIGSPQPSSNIFGQSYAPTAQSQESKTSPTHEGDSMMQISPDPSPQSRPFGFLNQPNAEPQPSPTKDNTAQGGGGSLFDRITRPPQANTQASLSSSPTKTNTTQLDGGGLFKTFQPTTKSDISTTNGEDKSTVPPRAPSPTKTPFSIGNRKIATPTLSKTPAEDAQPSYKNLFGSLKVQATSQPPPSLTSSTLSALPTPGNSQLLSNPNSPTPLNQSTNKPSSSSIVGQTSSSKAQKASDDSRNFGKPPSAPEDFIEEEKRQLTTGYRLKALDVGMQRHLRNNPGVDTQLVTAFYLERKQAILAAGGLPIEQLAGSKRSNEQHDGEAHGKKSRFESSPYVAEDVLPNGTGSNQSPSKHLTPLEQATKVHSKRKADEELMKDSAQGAAENGKKARSGDQVSYPSLPFASQSSQTSNIFKNILNSKKEEPAVNGTHDTGSTSSNLFRSQPPSSAGADPSSTQSLFQPKLPFGSSMPSPSTFTAQNPSTFGFMPADQAVSLSSSPSLFSNTKGTNGSVSAPAAKPPSFKPLSSSANSLTSGSSNPFSIKPSSSSEASSSTSKPPTFNVPKFGNGTTNFLSQFGKAAEKNAEEEKKKRKAADFDSDEEDEASWERRDAEEQRAKKKKLEEAARGKGAKIIDGKWTMVGENELCTNAPQETSMESSLSVFDKPSAPLTNGHNIFGHLSGEESGAEGSKTGDADDEDDGQDDIHEDDDEGDDGHDEDQEDGEDKVRWQKANSNPFGPHSSPSASPPSQHFTKPTGDVSGRSLFDRITKDESGKATHETPRPDTKTTSQGSNIFGQSRNVFGQSTFSGSSSNIFGQSSLGASNAASEKSSSTSATDILSKLPSSTSNQNVFGKLTSSTSPLDASKNGDSPKGDHTWKPESPIRFGGPEVNVTSPSPSKPAFGGLFGASPKTGATTETPAKPTSSLFSATPAKSPNVGFGFGPNPSKPAMNSLALPSNAASNTTSRATSPGATTGESATESTFEDDGAERHDQLDLTSGGPGEEDEDVVFQVKAKALTFDAEKKTWATRGVGPLRILKHKETSKTRILMRQEPNGRVIINSALVSALKYEDAKNKTVRVPILKDDGKPETWMARVGKDDDAKELIRILEENKSH